LCFYAASADSTAQTGHAGAGDWQEETYQMVRHDIDIIPFGTCFLNFLKPIERDLQKKEVEIS
jgi:hypothetical protein